jgi:uncharacterized protein
MQFNPSGKKAILSIDGGGMRGVICIAMLAELEQMTGRPAYELFDFVGGTSTGAIIATGLGLHMNAQTILDEVYKKRLPQSFGERGGVGFWVRWLMNGMRHFYSYTPFIEALLPLTKGKKLRDFSTPIVYMTTKDVRTGNTYYMVSGGKGAATFADTPISGAVAASGAAPIFFPPVLGNLIDGGVGPFGNPCLGAAIEASDYIGFDPANTLHISLGTGYLPVTYADGQAGRWWVKQWVEYMVVNGIYDAALQQVELTRRLYPQTDYRRYNPYLTRQSVEEKLGVPTAGRPDPLTLSLDTNDPASIQLLEDIGRAYARKIDWEHGNTVPWDAYQLPLGGHPRPGIAANQWQGSPYL